MSHVHTVPFTILVVLFLAVTLIGFGAARWRPAEDPMHLNEWGLGGRFAPRLWSVARARGYVTPGEFVRGRYGSQGLGLAVTFTGILATMPYIALQLVGIESVLIVLGVGGSSTGLLKDLPLIVAFIVLAAYTYLAGLRAPCPVPADTPVALASPGRALEGILRAAAVTDADWGSRTAMTCRYAARSTAGCCRTAGPET